MSSPGAMVTKNSTQIYVKIDVNSHAFSNM